MEYVGEATIQIDGEELEGLKKQAFLEAVIGGLMHLKNWLEEEGDPKEVLEKAIKEIEETGRTAVSIFCHDICFSKFNCQILVPTGSVESAFKKEGQEKE